MRYSYLKYKSLSFMTETSLLTVIQFSKLLNYFLFLKNIALLALINIFCEIKIKMFNK